MGNLSTIAEKRVSKPIVKVAAGLFIGLLLIWTLFGNMLQAGSLPKVITENPLAGSLNFTFKADAQLQPGVEVELTNAYPNEVVDITVTEGEQIVKGQVLIRYDSSAVEQEIKMEQYTLEKLKLSINEIENKYKEAGRQNDLPAMEMAKYERESQKIEILKLEQKIANMQSSLSNHKELIAPFDGVVTSIHAMKGLTSNGTDISLLNTERGFKFTVTVPTEVTADLKVNDLVQVSLPRESGRKIEGEITSISVQDGEGQTFDLLQVQLIDESLRQGDSVQIALTRTIDAESYIVSSKAIYNDREGAYVFTVGKKLGPFGNQFYVNKRYVTITGVNEGRTAILSDNWDQGEEIVIESSELLTNGQHVRY